MGFARRIDVKVDVFEVAAPGVVGHGYAQEPLQRERVGTRVGVDVAHRASPEFVEERERVDHVRGVLLAHPVGPGEHAEGPRGGGLVARADMLRQRIGARERGLAERDVARHLEHPQIREAELPDLVGLDHPDAVPASAEIAPRIVGASVVHVARARACVRDASPVPVVGRGAVGHLVGERLASHARSPPGRR